MIQILSIITSLATIAGIIIILYKSVNGPDVKASEEIKLIKQNCHLTHKSVDENLLIIKENHLKHIEETMAKQGEAIVKIKTILEERLPKKQ